MIAAFAASAACGQTRAFDVDSIKCDTATSWAFLLQADADPAPEWAVLHGLELTVSELDPDSADTTLALPRGATLFDCRDADGDGVIEMAAVRGTYLDYWPDALKAATTEPAVRIEYEGFAALAFGPPRPATLFFRQQGEIYLALSLPDGPRAWTLDRGGANPRFMAEPPPVELLYAQAWHAPSYGISRQSAGAFQIVQHYGPVRGVGSGLIDSGRYAGTRLARDAADAPAGDWPWFPIEQANPDAARAYYALAPPNYRDTLVRIGRPELEPGPRPAAAKIFAGVQLLPDGRPPDVNGDGFADLVLWRPNREALSLDALALASQRGTWEVTLTVHPFDPAAGRYAPRPDLWFRTTASLLGVVSQGVRGPFTCARFEDIDGDGRDELISSGGGEELVAWTYGVRGQSAPLFRSPLHARVSAIEFSRRVPAYGWVAIVKTPKAYYALTLPHD